MIEIRNDLPLLYDFFIVAQEKGFSKAAQKNNVSQPNLSRNIKYLEEKLKLILIKRTNKGIELTTDGEELYNKLNKIFGNITDYILDNNNINGTLTIGTTRNIADNRLHTYIRLFNLRYPNVKIKIWIDHEANLNERLFKHTIDVLIDYLPHEETDGLSIQKIDSFKTYFACSKEFYKKEKNNIKTINDLKKYNLIIPGKSRRKRILDNLTQENNIDFEPILEMPDSKLMAEIVKEGDYIGYFIEDEIKEYDLVKLELDKQMPINNFGIIYYQKTLSNIGKKFVDLVLEINDIQK